jgi:hypothetical protein
VAVRRVSVLRVPPELRPEPSALTLEAVDVGVAGGAAGAVPVGATETAHAALLPWGRISAYGSVQRGP